jgi:L-ascorbate metabolism protein UlaG (beta-lactamase superfamily)
MAHGYSAARIEAGTAEILIDLFLCDNPFWDKGGSAAVQARTRLGR